MEKEKPKVISTKKVLKILEVSRNVFYAHHYDNLIKHSFKIQNGRQRVYFLDKVLEYKENMPLMQIEGYEFLG